MTLDEAPTMPVDDRAPTNANAAKLWVVNGALWIGLMLYTQAR